MTIVDDRGALRIQRGTTIEPAYVELLSSTRFGTEKLRYRRRRVADTLDRLPATDYYSLYDKGRLIGGYALTPVSIASHGKSHKALYRHSLVVDESFQGQGLGHWLVSTALQDRSDETAFSFGSIEHGNRRSTAILNAASAQSIGTLRSELVYRHRTARSESICLNPDDLLVRAALDDSESDCLYRFANRREAPYFAVIDDGRILAGASARLNSLDLRSPGISAGRLYAMLIKLLPPARRRFDPADFRFVSLSDIVIDEGGGRAWNALVSHILNEFDVHMAGITLDPRRATYRRLSEQGLLGRFARATREEFSLLARPHANSVLQLVNQPTGLAPLEL